MAIDEHAEPVAQRFGWPAATAAVAASVGAVVGAAIKQDIVLAGAAIACLAVLVAWLTATTRAGAAARRRIERLEQQVDAHRQEFEQRAAAQREELDRLQLSTARLTRATSPDWLLVAIHHTEQTDGRIDVVPTGLRFVSAARESTWTVALPVRTDPAQQARAHSEETRFDDPSPLAAATRPALAHVHIPMRPGDGIRRRGWARFGLGSASGRVVAVLVVGAGEHVVECAADVEDR
jgi:hypothetical protein